MSGSSGDEAAQTLTTFLDGMPTPKERLNAAIRALLDERGRRHAGTNLGAGSSQMGPDDEAVGREQLLATYGVIGMMRMSLPERFEAIRTKYNEFAFSGSTDLDRERDQVIGFLINQVVIRRDERDAATARAEQAEADLDGYRAQLAQWAEIKQAVGDVRAMRERAARTEQAEAKVERLKARLEFAWNEGDRLASNLIDAVFGDDERRGEFQQKWSRIAALGDPEPEYRYLLADGTESEFDLHNRPCDCQRQVRDVYVTPWRPVEQQRQGGEERA